jgi:hypothetical protein
MANQASTFITMPSNSTATTTKSPFENARIRTIAQPHSRLHALPAEICDMIYEFAVVSPDYLPASITTRTVRVRESLTAERSQTRILPSQPPLSCTDRQIRTEVLRVFYQRNTFVFPITPLMQNPLYCWLFVLRPGGATLGRDAYAGGAARLIERVAIERKVRQSCVQHVEDRDALEEPVHTYRIVVGLEKEKRREEDQQDQQQHHHHHQQERQQQQRPHSSSSTHHRYALTVHFEADLSPVCACTLRLAASQRSPEGFERPWSSPRGGRVIAFAYDLQALLSTGLPEDCQWGGLCDEERTRVCEGCGKLVLKGPYGDGRGGFGGHLFP